MKILITGGAGYIGAHFINRLQGHDVMVVDNFCQGRKNIIFPKTINIIYETLDIRDKESLRTTFETFLPDVVVHYAALANVPDSVANPSKYYDTNILGGLNVLECMRQVGCEKIIFSSTAAVYGESSGTHSDTPLDDFHKPSPSNPYGRSKYMFEQILEDYYKAYKLHSISFRYFCATGCDESGKVGCYHDPETQVIPNICKTLLGQQEVFHVWGNDFSTKDGTGVRDYIHVNDLADAHILALDNIQGCEVYNLGINKPFSVMELIVSAEQVTGKKLNYKFSPRRAGDPAILMADSSKAQQKFGWTPKYTDIGEIILTDYNFFKTL